ncbi:3-oxoacyl-ACP reductase [Achromatium sp. WMS3]|nr:3-oxoacyl-ACP reductase [Achromatium sp. WMS3]
MPQLTDKTALITGAAGNLGRTVAQTYAKAGANLILVDLKAESLQETQAYLGSDTNCLIIPTDLINPESVAKMNQQALAKWGRIDILANIAGGFTMGPPLHETNDRDWNFMMDLNVRTVFNTCRAIIPNMLTHHSGTIINIAAKAALTGQANMGPYCASKAAVITLTETLAAEHLNTGIRINCVLPSILNTPQNRAAMPDANHASWVQPEALADVILFLASNMSRSVTGAALPVYGQS